MTYKHLDQPFYCRMDGETFPNGNLARMHMFAKGHKVAPLPKRMIPTIVLRAQRRIQA